ncbi:hypothetical protein [Flindersiella endophytica]
MDAEQSQPTAQSRPDGAEAFVEGLTAAGYGTVVVGVLLGVAGAIYSGPQYLVIGALIVIAGLLVLVLKALRDIQRTLSGRTTTSPPA